MHSKSGYKLFMHDFFKVNQNDKINFIKSKLDKVLPKMYSMTKNLFLDAIP